MQEQDPRNPPDELRILLTGSTGQVGSALLPHLNKLGSVSAPSRKQLDLTSAASIREVVRDFQPHWIINPAAYTAVDKAEEESDQASAINTDAPRTLAEEADRLNAVLIHFSTDYVFDGSGERPWREDDPTGPLNVYGATKLAGEQEIAQTNASHLIFRTSWVYGSQGKNFLLTMLRLARERESLRIVADQFGAPTCSLDLALLVAEVVNQAEQECKREQQTRCEWVRSRQGVYHASSQGEASWFGFAQYFLSLAAGKDADQPWARLEPISTDEYPTPARRPRNSRLDCTRLLDVFGCKLPAWESSAAHVIERISNASDPNG